MSLQKMVVVSCDGLDGDVRDFREDRCHGGAEESFLSVREALACLRELGWRVGKPDEFGGRPALCPVCVKALRGALCGAVCGGENRC